MACIELAAVVIATDFRQDGQTTIPMFCRLGADVSGRSLEYMPALRIILLADF
ncbi:hypothetical protein [Azorhizobium oxalatiphilum]|uniref:hypothetical protein n=1 Tax=Azorhizobium oxalatiphilum TaxID=980631 RepID=UPI001668B495|nr:hypothetical protein [Azorhizobium oxalatiphilum]